MSELYTETGIEKPTHTTAHNQVVVAPTPEPSQDLLDNYARLKDERELSWEAVAKLVEIQDPGLADWIRTNSDSIQKTEESAVEPLAPVEEVAVNPLSTPEDRGEETPSE